MVVFLALMPYCRDGDSAVVVDLKKSDIPRVTERDQNFPPAGAFLQKRLSAGERRVGKQLKCTFDGSERTLGRVQITFDQEIVEPIEVLKGFRGEADLICHLRARRAPASRLRSPAITLSAGT